MAGIRLEWAQFGDFDSFDVIRSDAPMDINALPSPIATNLPTMYYVDTTVVEGATYYYRVVAWRDGVSKVSGEIELKASSGDEHWDKVVSLLHFNGDLTDETGRVWNAVGNPTISNGELILDGSSGLTTSAAGFDFGTGDFTIEAFLRQTSPNSRWREIFMANAGYGINVMLYDKKLAIGREGVANDYVSTVLAPQDTLIHLALSRVAGVVKGFINGTQVFSGSYTQDFSSTALHSLGINNYGGNVSGLVGAIESFRVTKGVGRYTANFTPPDAPFPSA